VTGSSDPYRPTTVFEEGELLLVSSGGRLADVCVKCATHHGVGRRLEVMPHGVWSTIGLSLVWSTAFLVVVFPVAWVWPSGGAWLMALRFPLSVWIAGRRLRIGALNLPICGPCEARWKAVVRARQLATLGIVPVLLVTFLVYECEHRGRLPSGVGAQVALGLALVWVATLLALRRRIWRDRTVTSTAIEGELIYLRGVHADARLALRAEAAAPPVHGVASP
jgi:hypothetical protein